MKAALWYGKKDIRVEDVEPPKAEAGEVVVKVKRCGICGTDLHEYVDGPHVTWDTPHPITGDKVPIIMGHEFAGEISEVGKDVKGWKVGDRVAIMPLLHCGKCIYCLQGKQHLCVDFGCTGLQWHWGGFAEYCKALPYQLNRIPDDVTYEQAACIEPLAVAMHGVHLSRIKAGETVFIAGGGPIGLLTVLSARAAGASKIYASARSPRKAQQLKEFGVTEVFNPREVDVVAEIKARTNGLGTDIAIDCTGDEGAINNCFDVVKISGTFVQNGLTTKPTTFNNYSQIAAKEIAIYGVWCYNITDYPGLLTLMGTGQLEAIERVVTKVISVEDIVKEGFETLTSDKEKKELKIQVSFE